MCMSMKKSVVIFIPISALISSSILNTILLIFCGAIGISIGSDTGLNGYSFSNTSNFGIYGLPLGAIVLCDAFVCISDTLILYGCEVVLETTYGE